MVPWRSHQVGFNNALEQRRNKKVNIMRSIGKILLDVNAACKHLNVVRSTLYRWMKQADSGIERVKLGGKTYVLVECYLTSAPDLGSGR